MLMTCTYSDYSELFEGISQEEILIPHKMPFFFSQMVPSHGILVLELVLLVWSQKIFWVIHLLSLDVSVR